MYRSRLIFLIRIFSVYTTDAIASTAFGIQVDAGSNQLTNFIKLMKKIFDDNNVEHPIFVLSGEVISVFITLNFTFQAPFQVAIFLD